MALAGIVPNVTTDLTNLIGQTAFEQLKQKPDPMEQVQPKQLERLQAETDSVTISARARELAQNLSSGLSPSTAYKVQKVKG
ncbi:MAG: hypothetical protein D6704_08905 [Nitrospirae bacterium]|nr:MAG: hypothetical protein D6704_08905 [Nitrospirota bacterium]